MAELNSDSLGAGTWEDEFGGVIPKGTNLGPGAVYEAMKTLAEMALAENGDPEKGTPEWDDAAEDALAMLEDCGLVGSS
jgi:hypothetical protein